MWNHPHARFYFALNLLNLSSVTVCTPFTSEMYSMAFQSTLCIPCSDDNNGTLLFKHWRIKRPHEAFCPSGKADNVLTSVAEAMYGFEALTFNINDGYLEAIVRGYRGGLLTTADYNNLCQCESLDDIKLNLTGTDYGQFLQNGRYDLSRMRWAVLYSPIFPHARATCCSRCWPYEAVRICRYFFVMSLAARIELTPCVKIMPSDAEPSPLHTATIVEKCTQKLVDEFHHMRCQATEPLATFLDYIT